MSESYEIFSEFYDEFIAKNCPGLHEKYFKLLTGIIAEHQIKHDSILDASCGTGILVKMLVDAGYNVTGMDMNRNMLSKARAKRLDVFQGDIRNFSAKRKFDIIYSFDSLEHLTEETDMEDAFKSIHANLYQDGAFVFDCDSRQKINHQKNMTYTYSSDTYSFVWSNHDIADGLVDIELNISKAGGENYIEHHLSRAYSLTEFKEALARTGFHLIFKTEEPVTKNGSLAIAAIKLPIVASGQK